MDKQAVVHKRKKRYMAQLLTEFEESLGPHLPEDVAERFKGMVRQKLHALALDACEIISLKPGEELNGAVIDLRDQLHVGPTPTQRSESA